MFVNSPKAARFLVPVSCCFEDPTTTRLVPMVDCFASKPPALPDVVVVAAFFARTVDAEEFVLLMLGLMATVDVAATPGLTLAVLRDRVVGAFSSVSVLRAGNARVRRVCRERSRGRCRKAREVEGGCGMVEAMWCMRERDAE